MCSTNIRPKHLLNLAQLSFPYLPLRRAFFFFFFKYSLQQTTVTTRSRIPTPLVICNL